MTIVVGAQVQQFTTIRGGPVVAHSLRLSRQQPQLSTRGRLVRLIPTSLGRRSRGQFRFLFFSGLTRRQPPERRPIGARAGLERDPSGIRAGPSGAERGRAGPNTAGNE